MVQIIPLITNAQNQHLAYPNENRIQYQRPEKWLRYSTTFAHLYFTNGSDSIVKYTLENFQPLLKRMEKESGLKSKPPLNLIIYQSLQRFFETNIGSNQRLQSTFPTVSIDAGVRLLLPYDGNYQVYTRQLKKAILLSLWEQNKIISTSQNANNYTDLDAKWFKEGMINFWAEDFSLSDNDSLYAFVKANSQYDFEELLNIATIEQQQLLAKGFCWFLTSHYRKDALKLILELLRQKKSFATAISLVTKREWSQLLVIYKSWLFYQFKMFPSENQFPINDSLQPKKAVQQKNLISKLDSITYLFSSEDQNKRTIFLKNINGFKQLGSYRHPRWLQHIPINYPLTEVYNKDIVLLNLRGTIHSFSVFNTQGVLLKRIDLPQGIDGIKEFKIKNASDWILIAYRNGQSDVIRFDPMKRTIKTITNDVADNYNLQLSELTNITYYSGFPKPFDPNKRTNQAMSSKNYGTYKISLDKTLDNEILISSESTSIEQSVVDFNKNGSGIPVYQHFWFQSYIAQKKTEDSIFKAKEEKPEELSFTMALLQNPKTLPIVKNEHESTFSARNVRPYVLQLNKIWFNASINNDLFINRLQPYHSQLGLYKYPTIGGMIKGGYADIFENHEFNIGYKIPARTEGSDFFLRYKNKKNRIDWSLLYHRKMENLQSNPQNLWTDEMGKPYPATANIRSHYYEIGISYPFSSIAAINFTGSLRKNETIFLSTNRYSLDFPPLKDLWNINTLSYTVNSLQSHVINPNISKGIKYNLTLDGILDIGKKNQFSYALTQNITVHQPLSHWLVWHGYLNIAYSGGSEYILYNFGGIEKNIVLRVDSTKAFRQDAPYIFQQLVTPLRGFEQNTLWGNAYGTLNTEIFAQIFDKGLSRLKTKYTFINTLQIGLFSDFTIAKETWTTTSRWSIRNSFGLSLKTILANYPIRVDLAYPYNLARKPIIHLSLCF